MSATFICARCGIELASSEDSARVELAQYFPGVDASECDQVCSLCYLAILTRAARERRDWRLIEIVEQVLEQMAKEMQ